MSQSGKPSEQDEKNRDPKINRYSGSDNQDSKHLEGEFQTEQLPYWQRQD